jgi:hypothetical protein
LFWFATGFEIVPSGVELKSMLERPLDHQCQGALIHLSSENLKGPNRDGNLAWK